MHCKKQNIGEIDEIVEDVVDRKLKMVWFCGTRSTAEECLCGTLVWKLGV